MKLKISIVNEKHFLKNFVKERNIKNDNFDDPDFIDFEKFENAISNLSQGLTYEIKHKGFSLLIEESDLIIINGRIFYNNEYLREICSVRIFLQTDLDLLFSRHIFKKLKNKFELNDIVENYVNVVKPNYEQWIEPAKQYADLLISNFGKDVFSKLFNHTTSKENLNIIQILQDFLKYRLIEGDYQNKLIDDKMSFLGKL